MACPVSSRGTGAAASTVKVTYQRPSGSRETITIAGSSVATSTSGQDQTNRSGVAHLGQPQLAAAHGERAAGVVRALPGAAGLEPRVPGTPGEERAERLVLVPQRLLQRHRGHLVQERQIRVLLHRGQRPVGLRVRRGLALQVPAGLAGGQGAVPHDPDAAERAVQHRLLRLVGVGPAPVCRSHRYRVARVIEKLREPRRTGGCLFRPRCAGRRIPPGLKAGASSGRFVIWPRRLADAAPGAAVVCWSVGMLLVFAPLAVRQFRRKIFG